MKRALCGFGGQPIIIRHLEPVCGYQLCRGWAASWASYTEDCLCIRSVRNFGNTTSGARISSDSIRG